MTLDAGCASSMPSRLNKPTATSALPSIWTARTMSNGSHVASKRNRSLSGNASINWFFTGFTRAHCCVAGSAGRDIQSELIAAGILCRPARLNELRFGDCAAAHTTGCMSATRLQMRPSLCLEPVTQDEQGHRHFC